MLININIINICICREEMMDNLARTLTNLMAVNKLTSSELARKTGISQPVIYRLMTGSTENPQILTIKPIADYFGITIDQLAGYKALTSSEPTFDKTALHNIHNKLNTIKMISNVLNDTLPTLINGYQKACTANLLKHTIYTEMLPLLQLNTSNLLEAVNQIQELLAPTKIESKE